MKRIKYFLLVILSVFTLCIGSSCRNSSEGKTPTPPQIEIALNLHTADIIVGGKVTLKATVVGSAANIAWASSDNEVAIVDDGIVYGLSNGTATITATVGDAQASCKINVSGGSEDNNLQPIPVLHFDLTVDKIWVGYSFTPLAVLKIAGEPIDVEITLKSADATVVKIEDEKIVAVSEGTTTIIASCYYDGELYQKIATIEVVAKN